MWTNLELFTAAKTSVPVLLFNVEQIFCANFMVLVFSWWIGKVENGSEEEEGRSAGSSDQSGATVSGEEVGGAEEREK